MKLHDEALVRFVLQPDNDDLVLGIMVRFPGSPPDEISPEAGPKPPEGAASMPWTAEGNARAPGPEAGYFTPSS